jgi:sporulation protein YlmC with PRC-barrel domain
MGELRVGATVRGSDGDLGTVDALVLDPVRSVVTDVVVQSGPEGHRVLVPMAAVTSSDPTAVVVGLDAAALAACPPFDEPGYHAPSVEWQSADLSFDPGTVYLQPFVSAGEGWSIADHERIPLGEVTVRRGDVVRSSDGTDLGHVDELLVDPSDGGVTHLVLREAHILTRDDDVVVPVAGATFDEGEVRLGIDLAAVHALDHLPVKRHHHVVVSRLDGHDDDGV